MKLREQDTSLYMHSSAAVREGECTEKNCSDWLGFAIDCGVPPLSAFSKEKMFFAGIASCLVSVWSIVSYLRGERIVIDVLNLLCDTHWFDIELILELFCD